MSITYDPEKWSSPLKMHELGQAHRRSPSPVVVSLRELRYFKARPDINSESISAFLALGEPEEEVVELKRKEEE